MLVIGRFEGEKIRIGDDITILVLEVTSDRVRLAFDAPREVLIQRAEKVIPPEDLPCPPNPPGS